MKKIVLIGAGSVVFTQGLVMDLISHTGDMRWELVLVDTQEETIEVVRGLVEKMIAQKGAARVSISYTTDRKQALPNADYVVTTIGVGSRRAWEQDVFGRAMMLRTHRSGDHQTTRRGEFCGRVRACVMPITAASVRFINSMESLVIDMPRSRANFTNGASAGTPPLIANSGSTSAGSSTAA